MAKLVAYPDLKLDLTSAFSLLDDYLSDAESWEVYAAIEMGEYDEALSRMRELAQERGARVVLEELDQVSRHLTSKP